MADDSAPSQAEPVHQGARKRVYRSAQAAALAAQDAQSAARSASETSLAALQAAISAATVAKLTRDMAAETVAAAAVATADLAARTASAVEIAAAARAQVVANSALAALESIAAQLPDGVDPDVARLAAASVAARVAADLIAQQNSTEEAARIVAAAVTMAAQATALAATAAAETVALEAGSAAQSGDDVARSSFLSEAASERAVASSSHVMQLALQAAEGLAVPPMAAELDQALLHDELELHYQPQYRLDTGELVAVEALLRWQNPLRGLLPPADFLAAAESHPLITRLGDWVLDSAIAQAGSWLRQTGASCPRVWVNVSCEQFDERHHLPSLVTRLLSKHGVPAAKFGIELTERQVALRADAVGADLEQLRELGVSLSVDDFGTGYASLDYLRRFSFDEIKIDQSFVSGIRNSRTDTAVASSIITLGHALDMRVVAEGVETQEQLDMLRDLGCDLGQGYLLHRPVPADQIGRLLTAAAVS